MNWETLRPEIRWAVEAAQDKKARNVTVLDLSNLAAFSQYFLLCSGTSSPQLEAITDAIEERLRQHGIRPQHREGRPGAGTPRIETAWSERLWRAAPRADIPSPDDAPPHSSSRGGPFSSPSAPGSGTTQP